MKCPPPQVRIYQERAARAEEREAHATRYLAVKARKLRQTQYEVRAYLALHLA